MMEVPLFRQYTVFIFFQLGEFTPCFRLVFCSQNFYKCTEGPKGEQPNPDLSPLGAVFFLFQTVCIRESYLYNLFIFLNPAISWRQCQKNLWEDITTAANPSELLQVLQYVVASVTSGSWERGDCLRFCI